jgi:hypothetical protein
MKARGAVGCKVARALRGGFLLNGAAFGAGVAPKTAPFCLRLNLPRPNGRGLVTVEPAGRRRAPTIPRGFQSEAGLTSRLPLWDRFPALKGSGLVTVEFPIWAGFLPMLARLELAPLASVAGQRMPARERANTVRKGNKHG